MKKILLICEKYPLPEEFGGAMRTMNFVRFFLKCSEMEIAYSASPPTRKGENSPFKEEYLLDLRPIPEGYNQHFWKFTRGVPHPIGEYTEGSQRMLMSLVQSDNYDYILFRRYLTVGNLINVGKEKRKKIIIDFDDIVSGPLYQSYFYPTQKITKRVLRLLNRKLLSIYERRCLKVGACLFCSAKDRTRVGGVERKNMFVVPNIYDSRSFNRYDFGDGFGKENNLLFLGSLDYQPNIEGLMWFVKSIYGEFKMMNTEANLMVVGKAPNREIKDLCRNMGIELKADVRDVKEFYKRCRAVVVPVLNGGGTRIKILEAGLAGRPVLSTPMGADGLDLRDGRELLLFENLKEFCLQYEMLKERDRYVSIVENAKKAVLLKYSKEVFDDSMRRVMNCING